MSGGGKAARVSVVVGEVMEDSLWVLGCLRRILSSCTGAESSSSLFLPHASCFSVEDEDE